MRDPGDWTTTSICSVSASTAYVDKTNNTGHICHDTTQQTHRAPQKNLQLVHRALIDDWHQGAAARLTISLCYVPRVSCVSCDVLNAPTAVNDPRKLCGAVVCHARHSTVGGGEAGQTNTRRRSAHILYTRVVAATVVRGALQYILSASVACVPGPVTVARGVWRGPGAQATILARQRCRTVVSDAGCPAIGG